MLDIIGIGSLNLDYTLTTEKLKALPAAVAKELMAKVERGAEKFAAEAAIKEGATESEVAGALATAIALNAGAAYTYALRALEAYQVNQNP